MTRTSAADLHHQRGFTLLELMLVLAILAMLATLVAPRLNSLDAPSFNAQVRDVTSLLNYARRTAVVQGNPVRVRIASAADETGKPEADSFLQWTGRELDITYTLSTSQQIDVDQHIDLVFYPEGGSTGGQLTFVQGSRQATVEIDPFSGRVRRLTDE